MKDRALWLVWGWFCLFVQTLAFFSCPAQAHEKTNLFGTIEFKRPSTLLPVWNDMLGRNKHDTIFKADKYFNRNTSWASLKEKARNLDDLGKLKLVNTFWNKWPWRDDQTNWNMPDYWAAPYQFLKKSGDCEDYAIVKYFTLKELGVSPNDMRIVVLRDSIRKISHAVLAVYLKNTIYILDNLSNVVLPHSRISNYVPQISVNEAGCWAHVRCKSGLAKKK